MSANPRMASTAIDVESLQVGQRMTAPLVGLVGRFHRFLMSDDSFPIGPAGALCQTLSPERVMLRL
jgi:hypothetical protein